jgi:hypothetical protein
MASNIVLFALVAGSPEPANCGLATVVMWISGSVDLAANEINIMKKKLDLISVVLYRSRILCISQATFKRGRELFLATCC